MSTSLPFSNFWLERYPARMKVPVAIAQIIFYVLVGCQSSTISNGSAAAKGPSKIYPADGWPFEPKTIFIHPLSYFPSADSSERNLKIGTAEIYVQCNDLNDQTTRASGFMSVMVQDPISKTCSTFQVDLSDMGQNLKYWDSVTHTYRFPIPLPDGFECAPQKYILVTAELNLGAGNLIKATGEVACPKK